MGRFATGVTVVTTTERDTIHGMTANALPVGLAAPATGAGVPRALPDERDAARAAAATASACSPTTRSTSPPTSPHSGRRRSSRRSSGRTACRCSTARWPTSAAGWSTCTERATTCCGSARSSISITATTSRCFLHGPVRDHAEIADRESGQANLAVGRDPDQAVRAPANRGAAASHSCHRGVRRTSGPSTTSQARRSEISSTSAVNGRRLEIRSSSVRSRARRPARRSPERPRDPPRAAAWRIRRASMIVAG